VQIQSEGRVLLFTGDIGKEAEQDILRTTPDLRADLIKVPHHGSKSSSSDAFVAATHPGIAVMTVGKGNRYRHPSDEVISRYQQSGSRIYRTDRDGAVVITMRKNGLDTRTVNALNVRRIDIHDHDSWWTQERENGNRLLIRSMAF